MYLYAFLSSPIIGKGDHSQKTLNPNRVQLSSPTWTCSSKPIFSRRAALQLALAFAAFQSKSNSVNAVTNSSTAQSIDLGSVEKDDLYGYSYRAPPLGWSRSIATLSSMRTATIFVCDDDSDSNISMVATPVPGDFQKLTSFGTIDNVLSTMVPKGKDIDGEVLSTSTDSKNNAYLIEYTVNSKGVKRHLFTVFSLQPGQYLITLTGQTREENWQEREPVIKAVAKSYSLISRA